MSAVSHALMLDKYRDGVAATKRRVDFLGGESYGMALHNAAAAPGGPATGQIYWDTAMGTFRVWNGEEWVTFGIPSIHAFLGSGTAAAVAVGHNFGQHTTTLIVAGRYWIRRETETETPDVWQYEETADGDGNYNIITPRYKIDANAPCVMWYLPIPAL